MSDLSKASAWSKEAVSTISYNTYDFLRSCLNSLVIKDEIYDYWFVHHDGENGKKDHYHVLIFPTRSINLSYLRDYFDEQCEGSDPLGVMPFRKTSDKNIADWLLYCLHDENYLRSKNMIKEKKYDYDDIVRHNEDHFRSYLNLIVNLQSDISILAGYVAKGFKWYRVADLLLVKRNDLCRFKQTYEALATAMGIFEDLAADIVTGSIEEVTLMQLRKKQEDYLNAEIEELKESLSSAYNVIEKLLEFKNIDLEDIVQ